jgi:hypothetical protein
MFAVWNILVYIVLQVLTIRSSNEGNPRIGGVIVSVLPSSVVDRDRGFEPQSGQTGV